MKTMTMPNILQDVERRLVPTPRENRLVASALEASVEIPRGKMWQPRGLQPSAPSFQMPSALLSSASFSPTPHRPLETSGTVLPLIPPRQFWCLSSRSPEQCTSSSKPTNPRTTLTTRTCLHGPAESGAAAAAGRQDPGGRKMGTRRGPRVWARGRGRGHAEGRAARLGPHPAASA